MGKNWKKFFEAKTLLKKKSIFRKKNIRVVFRLETTGEKIASFKIPIDEYEKILFRAHIRGKNFEEYVLESIRDYAYR